MPSTKRFSSTVAEFSVKGDMVENMKKQLTDRCLPTFHRFSSKIEHGTIFARNLGIFALFRFNSKFCLKLAVGGSATILKKFCKTAKAASFIVGILSAVYLAQNQ